MLSTKPHDVTSQKFISFILVPVKKKMVKLSLYQAMEAHRAVKC
jgi:hypothetical protein